MDEEDTLPPWAGQDKKKIAQVCDVKRVLPGGPAARVVWHGTSDGLRKALGDVVPWQLKKFWKKQMVEAAAIAGASTDPMRIAGGTSLSPSCLA